MRPPHILHLICHDLGRHLGCYGAPVASPNLDRFAAQGLRFDRAFTNSVACSPARCCVMTGQYAHSSGGIGLSHMGWPLPDEATTLVDLLRAAGYQTAHTGLNHERHPRCMRYEVEADRHWQDWNVEHAVDDAIAFLAERADARPFFLNIGTQEVHATRFTRDEIVADTYGGRIPADDTYIPNYLADTPAHRHLLGGFQAAIRHFDHHVGRLLDWLDRSPYGDDTLVVITTDHGIWTPSCRDKGTLWERGVEVTLLARPPRAWRQPQVVGSLVSHIDLLPTYLDAAGAAIPAHLPGRSWWPLVTGAPFTGADLVFTERNFHGEHAPDGSHGYVDRFDPLRAVRSDRFHYIRVFDPAVKPDPGTWLSGPAHERAEEYLYDVGQDQMELVNLAGRPEYRRILADHRGHLARWMQETDDFLLRGEVPAPRQAPGWGERWPWQAERTPFTLAGAAS